MATHYVNELGDPILDGKHIQPIGFRTIVKLDLHTMSRISPSVIMNLLKKHYDCREVDIETEIVTCKVQN